jgi:hypothetical protein
MLPQKNTFYFNTFLKLFSAQIKMYVRHEKSGDLGDPGLRKILQIAEDLNKKVSSEKRSNEQTNVITSK